MISSHENVFISFRHGGHDLSHPRPAAHADPQADPESLPALVLFYVPYVTLAVMTFPAIMNATQSPIAGAAAMVIGIVAAWCGLGLLPFSLVCCATVLILEHFIV